MQEVLCFLLAAVIMLIAVELIAAKTGLPTAALLTVGGLLYALLPGPDIQVPPDAVMTLVLPPLLYSAALNSSLIAIRRNLRSIVSLSVVLVLLTATAVGVGFSLVVPGATLAAGMVLGAAVSPPDPVAALAAARRAGLPSKLTTLIEGEGLLNDATALTALTVAITATTTGEFSPASAVLHFVVTATGGTAIGVLVAALVHWLRRVIREPLLVNAISLATPFAACLLGELLHTSAVLAVVVAGLLIGHETPRAVSGSSRLQTRAVWRLIDFLLEGFVFLLIGQQLPLVLHGLRAYPLSTLLLAAGTTLGCVLLVRPLWLFGTQWFPRRLHLRLGGNSSRADQRLSGREIVALSWTGTRGVITITSTLTLPLTALGIAPFPDRNLLLFCAYLTVIVTLVGQGATFVPLVRLLRLRGEPDHTELHDRARAAAARAALAQLDDIAYEHLLDASTIERLRRGLDHRAQPGPLFRQPRNPTAPHRTRHTALAASVSQAQRQVIDVQRSELVRWRRLGHLPDDSLRLLHNELDHEEGSLDHGGEEY
ncbi:Na+/H+ antiporter [Streptomyces sp. SID10853]|uniref:Na+/H+ antiporter n=1 Tax=Streptomyces sp. SID10853 TaxID=2706028 RepID=UPI0013C181DD|nr:Na+/H+ antiporter [Streptomyces sp. SID10853]